jgi:tetratricopeptide (TPR) repeat protein
VAAHLSDNPLAELICEITNAQLSGVLRISTARAKGLVYFDNGLVVNALTNILAYRLVEMLQRSGSVAAEKLADMQKRDLSDDAVSAELLTAGLLNATELKRIRERLATEVLRQLLKWTSGEWSFDGRARLPEQQHVPVDAATLLIESARLLAHDFSAKRFLDPAEMFIRATETEALNAVPLLPAEAFVLSRIDGPLTLGELNAVSGLPEDHTRDAIYVLVLLGHVQRGRPLRALPAEVIAQAQAANRTMRSPVESTKSVGYQSILDGALAALGSAPPEPEVDPREELAELFALNELGTHYEVLGLVRAAKPEQIKRAYYGLARRFHPDRFRRVASESELQRVEHCFARIAQAYEVLKDPANRAVYDHKISVMKSQSGAGGGAASSAAGSSSQARSAGADVRRRAEETFQQGLAALKQKDFARASQRLHEAVLLAPSQPRYRAYYGQMLAREKSSQRQAEAELQTAVQLDTQNVTYRVMLAELYRDVGFLRRAESELEHALLIDREHEAAKRLLDEIRRRG